MPEDKKIMKHSTIFLLTQVVILSFSLVTFPVFTRVLSKSDYGLLNVITITLTLFTLFFSGNMKDAILRFYGEYSSDGQSDVLFSNTLAGTLIFSIAGVVLGFLAAIGLYQGHWISGPIFGVLLLAIVLAVARNVTTAILSVYRVRDEIYKYNLILLINKATGTLLCIYLVAYLLQGLFGLFLGLVISEAGMAIVLAAMFLKRNRIRLTSCATEILRKFLKYSMPLIYGGVSSYLLNWSDRYLISFFLTNEDVAVYSVAYTLPDYIQTSIILSFNMSLYPVIMNLWGKREHQEAEKTLFNFVNLYMLIIIPMVFGILSLRRELIEVLASAKYSESSSLLPLVTIGIMLRGLYFPCAAGLYREKKTATLAWIMWGGALFNISLNLALIPFLKLQGCAIATLVSYVFILVLAYRYSSRYQRLQIAYKKVFVYIALSLVMFIVVRNIDIFGRSQVVNLTARVIAGVLVYSAGIVVCDRNIKFALLSYLSRFKGR